MLELNLFLNLSNELLNMQWFFVATDDIEGCLEM